MGTMLDSIDVQSLPPGYSAYAGYVGGSWPTYGELVNKFPGKEVLSIAVFASQDATALDDEPGDATNAEVYAWYQRQKAHGVARPVVYTSTSNSQALLNTMSANGIARSQWRLWSAHYTGVAHICGPSTCGYPQADATQWNDTYQGRNVDVSEYSDDFFTQPAPKPAPKPVEEDPMSVAIPLNTAVGVSFDGAPYKTIGFLADPGVLGGGTVSVRCAFHNVQTNSYTVVTVHLTVTSPKAVVNVPANSDGVSFTREDSLAATLYPNFA